MPKPDPESEENLSPELEMALIALQKAGQDLVAVQKWLTDIEVADEIIGFHIQQAIEKSLKAVLLSRAIDYPRTHNLGLLLELCGRNNIQIPTDFSQVDIFNRFAVQWRYELLPSSDQLVFDRQAAYDLAQHICAWANDRVNDVLGGNNIKMQR